MSKKPTRRYPKKQAQKNRKWLPILVTLGGFLLVFLAFLALRNQSSDRVVPEVTGSPSLKVDKEEVDLGDVKLNQPVQVSFTLTNIGDQPLRIEEKPYIEVIEGC